MNASSGRDILPVAVIGGGPIGLAAAAHPASRALLEAHGWNAPSPDTLPTGGDLAARYLGPLAAVPAMAAAIRTRSRVTAIAREGFDKVKTAGREQAAFVLHIADAGGGAR